MIHFNKHRVVALVFCILVYLHLSFNPVLYNSRVVPSHSVNLSQSVNQLQFKNIILMIGDGMGYGQLNATRKSLGIENLSMDTLPYIHEISTYSLNNPITDSAASATAFATGNLTNNRMISMTPSGERLNTILEASEALSKSTGLVTTTRLTHATPAAFASHVTSRDQESDIANQMLNQSIDVLLGGGRTQFLSHLDSAKTQSYFVIENQTQLLLSGQQDRLFGLFSMSHMSYDLDRDPSIQPTLKEMVNISLQILSRNSRGFFLVVEGGRIDHACHRWDINNTIGDTKAFDDAVAISFNFTLDHPNTILIVTADHETGGLVVNMSNPILDYKWTTDGHTESKVPLFIYTEDVSQIPLFNHTSEIGAFLFEVFGLEKGEIPQVWLNPVTHYQDNVLSFFMVLFMISVLFLFVTISQSSRIKTYRSRTRHNH